MIVICRCVGVGTGFTRVCPSPLRISNYVSVISSCSRLKYKNQDGYLAICVVTSKLNYWVAFFCLSIRQWHTDFRRSKCHNKSGRGVNVLISGLCLCTGKTDLLLITNNNSSKGNYVLKLPLIRLINTIMSNSGSSLLSRS